MKNSSDAILERLMALHPKVIDLTLDRVYTLLEKLGNPQSNLPKIVHIAGTNGKGSTLAMIRAGLEGVGKTVHCYTSPHLTRFHERIRLAGELISEEALTALLDECESANDNAQITYFEITTVAAILAFSRIEADYLLLEVGLGGRLDATNVIDAPYLSVITPISLDHQQFLGETIEEIAFEKAGILKQNCFGVIAKQSETASKVIENHAWEIGTTLKAHGVHWHIWEERGMLMFQDEYGHVELPLPNLLGAHQIDNAGTALAALRLLGEGAEALEAAMTMAEWPARLQRLKEGPFFDMALNSEIWLDGGHNPAAAEAIAQFISAIPQKPTYIIVGMLNSKDAKSYLNALLPHALATYTVEIEDNEASFSAKELSEMAKTLGFKAEASSLKEAIADISSFSDDPRIIICGSLYLAGLVLRDHS